MVDAVGPINSAVNSILQQKKMPSINWRNLTAKEVLEYAMQGQDAPLDILRWAQDYSKQVNAPDDVSYDAANGSTDTEEINAEKTDETTEEVNENEASAEETEEEEELTPAQQERLLMEENGASLYAQGKTFIRHSRRESGVMRRTDLQIKAASHKASAINTHSKILTAKTLSQTKSIKSQFDEILKKVETDISKVSPSDLNKLARLGRLLQQYGTDAQNKLANYDMQLQAIEEEFAQYAELPPEAADYGSETIKIGEELKNNAGKRRIFNPIYTTGRRAVSEGTRAVSLSEKTDEKISNSQTQVAEFLSLTNDNKDKVEAATMVEGINTSPDKKPEDKTDTSNNNKDTSKTSTTSDDKNSNAKVDKTAPENKDTALLTDPLEIQKRKEAQGLA